MVTTNFSHQEVEYMSPFSLNPGGLVTRFDQYNVVEITRLVLDLGASTPVLFLPGAAMESNPGCPSKT